MTSLPFIIAAAFVLDLTIGDPPRRTHPVILIGRLISLLEGVLWKDNGSKPQVINGTVLIFVVIAITGTTTWGLLCLADLLSPFLSTLFQVWFLSTTFALRNLAQSALKVEHELISGQLEEARKSVGVIVGRETDELCANEISRAAVESVAENTSDGLIAPLFFAYIGGLPLAMIYKAINTMDSMLGYRNPRYLYFGRAAAKIDDIVNYIPARITALIFILSGVFLRLNWKNGWRTVLQDSRNHTSPNSGFPEAAVAGLLNIRLGGPVCCMGKKELRSYIGVAGATAPHHITLTIKLLYVSGLISVFIGSFIYLGLYLLY